MDPTVKPCGDSREKTKEDPSHAENPWVENSPAARAYQDNF